MLSRLGADARRGASLDELSKTHPELALQLTVNLARILCGKLVNVHARAFGS